jgi:hypothetical protein
VITYLVRRRHRYTIDLFLATSGGQLPFRLEPLAYEHAFRARRLPAGTTIFSDVDRLGREDQARAAELWRALASAPGAGARILNDPIRSMRRVELLRELYERGYNDFDVVRLADARRPKRFPVFLRREDGHEGSLSDLLHTPEELATALRKLEGEGMSREGLLAVEYDGAADARGLHHKYAAFVVGECILPRHLFWDRAWCVKVPRVLEDEQVEAELEYVRTNPHAAALAEIARIARIEYGRIDYAVIDGRVRVWEINTNPMTVGDEGLPVKSRAVQDHFAASFIDALAGLDAPARASVALPRRRDRRRRAREWVLEHLSDALRATGLARLEPRVRMALYRAAWRRKARKRPQPPA